jgi:GNAT superfamily N-acetyltransferase
MLPNSRAKKVEKKIPHAKSLRRYPALLIGRLGVNAKYQDKGVGSDLLSFISSWFVKDDNKSGCRFLLVDAYNNPKTLNFYERNGFLFLFSTEAQEAESAGLSSDSKLKTRIMFYDLLDSIQL